jgi:hypothetical protein
MNLVSRQRALALFILLFTGQLYAAEDKPFTRSVVIFNTVCAKCHEAECSGRLSFNEAFETASSHIIRHYGEASGDRPLQKELFTILNYMKGKCAYYPMPFSVPADRDWNSDMLEPMATSGNKSYFIPVGSFSQGAYRLELTLAENVKVTVHLVSDTFDMVVEDCYESNGKRIEIPFEIEDAGNYYLRIYPRKPVQVMRLAISPQDGQGSTP